MNIFIYENYREFVLASIHSLPKRGRGEFKKIGEFLGMHSTTVSLVFRGDKELTLEQACGLAEYLGLRTLETDYFLCLVSFSRAGTRKLKETLGRQMKQMQALGKKIGAQVAHEQILNDQKKATFYSSWRFSAVRLLTSVPEYQNIEAISQRLGLPRKHVSQVMEFLLSSGLCVQKDGKLQIGPSVTHLDANSPFVLRHHVNWRLQALERYDHFDHDKEVAYTGPMTLSQKDVQEVRSQAIKFVAGVVDTARRSPSEELYCLNLDWFKV